MTEFYELLNEIVARMLYCEVYIQFDNMTFISELTQN